MLGLNKKMVNNNVKEFTSINTRLPSEVLDTMKTLCQVTGKSVASLVTNAVEHYVSEVKQEDVKDAMLIDRFAYKLHKDKELKKNKK